MAQPQAGRPEVLSDRALLQLLERAQANNRSDMLDGLTNEQVARLEQLTGTAEALGLAEQAGAAAAQTVTDPAFLTEVVRKGPISALADWMSPDAIVNALPMLGGVGFSLAAGGKRSPAGMGMAGLGGAAGEGARQVVESLRGRHATVPETASGRLKAMGREGLIQAGAEGAGRTLAASGRALMRQAAGVRLSDVAGFGDVGGTMVKEGISVGPGMARQGDPARLGLLVRGSARTSDLARTQARDVTAVLATKTAPTITGKAALGRVDDVLKDILTGTAGTYEKDRALVSNLRAGLKAELAGGITPTRAHELKSFYADKAHSLYERQSAGVPVTDADRAALRFYQAAADGLRAEVSGQVPGYAVAERRLQKLMGAERVVTRAEQSRFMRHGEFGASRVPPIAALIQALSDPAVWSRVARFLNTEVVKQVPKAATPPISEAMRQ